MTAKRILLAVVWAGLFGAAAFGQPGLVPNGSKPMPPPGGTLLPPPPPSSTGSGFAPSATPATNGTGATAVLTAPTGLTAQGLPPGSVASPWCGGRPAGDCCGPVGANGPIVYELYARTGPNIIVGQEGFSGPLKNGWNVAGGGRSLFMNQAGDAAWVLDFGLQFTYNSGDLETLVQALPTPRFVGQQTDIDNSQNPGGTPTTNTDTAITTVIQRMTRTTLNYSVGRDWWLNGPGYVGGEHGWNSRVGIDLGGRWGTAHVEFLPQTTTINYFRRQGITHSVFVGSHWNCEVPVGAWILFGGLRAEWGRTWTNLIPPNNGDLQDVNLLMTLGVRF